MPKTEGEPLGPGFDWRLSVELNRVRPRWSSPRYLNAPPHRVGPWRLAPAGVVAGVIGILALSAYAATGSANPVVWEQRIVTTIQPIVVPEATSAPTPAEPQREVAPAPEPTSHENSPPEAEGTESSEPSQHSGGDDHSGSKEASNPAGD